MNTDVSTTGRAMPSFGFLLHKVHQSVVFYLHQVLEQARIVSGAVTLVELFQTQAGEFITGITEMYSGIMKVHAVPDDTLSARFRFVSFLAQATVANVFIPQVG